MKTIAKSVDLRHEFESIGMSELRKQPGEVIESVKLGKTFLITKAGKPIGVLSPVPGDSLTKIIWPDGSVSWRKSS